MFQRIEVLGLVVAGVRSVAIIQDGGLPLISGPCFLVLLAWCSYTVWRRRVFVVNANEVCMGYVHGSTYIARDRWPRDSVGEIRANPHDGKLLIRITGKDLKEYSIGRDRRTVEFVADVLQQTLKEMASRGSPQTASPA